MSLVIYGCGGHARSVADVALSSGVEHLVFIDERAQENEKIFDFDVLTNFKDQYNKLCIVAVGDNRERALIFNKLIIGDSPVISIISNTAYLGKNAEYDLGVFVGHAAHIGPYAKIGDATLINTHCIIEHECIVGKYCHISVNAVLAGRTKIGDFVTIGAGATVIDGLNICSNVVIGAGAVVVEDICEPGVYVGVPARKVG